MAAVYWPGLHGAFFFDDGPSILLAPGVQLVDLSWDALRQAWLSGGAGPSGRPIAQLSFGLNYYFTGFSPFAFKVTNLAIHAACDALVLGVAQRLIRATYPLASHPRVLWAAGAVAALWLLHPIQVLPVLHVVQRMTSLSALFLLAALWLHIAARESVGGRAGALQLLVAWVVLWPLSYLSKETGVLFPVFALAWELLVRRATVGRLDVFARALVALSVVAALAISVYVTLGKAQWLWAGFQLRPFSMAERVLTEGRVLWIYLGLMLLPRLSSFGLYHDDIALSTGWLTPWTTLPAGVGLIALLYIAWTTRRRAPLISFGIVWFFIGHALESSVLPLEIAHEHRNYLPLLGVLLGGLGALLAMLQRLQPLSQRSTRIGLSTGILVLVAVSAITALRAHQFGDEVRRTQMAAQDHPKSALTQYEAGSALAGLPGLTTPDSPLYSSARRYFVRANELNPVFKLSGLGLIYLSCKTGQHPQPADVAELAHRLRDTPFAPGDRTVVYNLKEMALNGTLCLNRQDMDGLFVAAIANPSVSPFVRAMLLSWHADYLWLHAHDMSAARGSLGQSLALNPGNPSNRLKWAQLLYISGERNAASKLLLALRGENLSGEERKTLEELLAAINITPQ
jgi:hypothetical protein